MLRKDLIALMERNGWRFKRHGGEHDLYVKGNDRESIPRHRTVVDTLAKAIIKRRGLK